jgi:hypothetical protein
MGSPEDPIETQTRQFEPRRMEQRGVGTGRLVEGGPAIGKPWNGELTARWGATHLEGPRLGTEEAVRCIVCLVSLFDVAKRARDITAKQLAHFYVLHNHLVSWGEDRSPPAQALFDRLFVSRIRSHSPEQLAIDCFALDGDMGGAGAQLRCTIRGGAVWWRSRAFGIGRRGWW